MYKTIAIVGPSLSGKSSVFKMLKKKFKSSDSVNFVYIDEVATDLLSSKVYDNTFLKQLDIFNEQLRREEELIKNAKVASKDTVILTDRCAVDIFVYLTQCEVDSIISCDLQDKLLSRYDLIIYLQPYTDILDTDIKKSNSFRLESSIEELNELAVRTELAYSRVKSKIVYIDSADTIEEKSQEITKFIQNEIGIWRLNNEE